MFFTKKSVVKCINHLSMSRKLPLSSLHPHDKNLPSAFSWCSCPLYLIFSMLTLTKWGFAFVLSFTKSPDSSLNMSASWAGLKMRRGKKTPAFWLKKKRLSSTKMFHSGHNFILHCSPELKKGPKGIRHIMSNLSRQWLTGLKLFNFHNWWELELTGQGEGHSLCWKKGSYKVL